MTRRDWYCEDVLRPRETGSVLAPTSPHPALRRTFSALVRVPIGRIDARARAARLARDVLHSSVAQGLRALVVVVGISTGSGCAKRQAPQGKSEEASAARSAKDLKALTSAATGQWRAPWGRLS